MYYIYSITNLINGKLYIGQTINPNKRWRQHQANNRMSPLNNSIKKYGAVNFIYQIIAQAKSLEDIDILEIQIIKQYDSTNPTIGYNIEPGGNGRKTPTEESRRKMSESRRGKKHSKEWCENISLGQIGKIISEETYRHLQTVNIGRKHTDETKQKVSESLKGNNRRTGIPHSQETKDRISKTMKEKRSRFNQ